MPLTRKLASKSLIKQNTNQDAIGTGVTNLTRNAFTGNGIQTAFTLTAAPQSAANTQVFISGVYQNKDTYTISGTTLTFTTPPPSAASIEVMTGTNYSIGVPGDGTVTNAKLAVAPANTIKANNTAGSASPTDITIPQLAAMFTAPTVQRLTSGTNYTTPANVKYIKIRMVGGGGGGAGGVIGSTVPAAGGNGTATLWKTSGGSTLLQANGGNGGIYPTGGTGGTVSITSSPAILTICSLQGGSGSGAGSTGAFSNAAYGGGGFGASSPFGGAGGGGILRGDGNVASTGSAAIQYTGSGGGGGYGTQSSASGGGGGGGGGSGGYIEVIITSPSSSYTYTLGTGGSGGTASGAQPVSNGGAGADGIIIVEEYYQ